MDSLSRKARGPAAAQSLPLVPRWAKHRAMADAVARAFGTHPDAAELLRRMAPCAQRLGLHLSWADGGAVEQQVTAAKFCQQRFCPVCDWRRTVAWRRRLLPGLDHFHSEHRSHKPVFLTLTVRNCPMERTAEAIRVLHQGWNRLVQRSEFPTPYWVRRTELTVGNPSIDDDGAPTYGVKGNQVVGYIDLTPYSVGRAPSPTAHKSDTTEALNPSSQNRCADTTLPLIAPDIHGRHWIHPHIHALLMVPSRYFAADYIRQSRWRELWMDAARLDYAPIVDVRRGYVRKREESTGSAHLDAAIEASKYISKHSNLLSLGPAIAALQHEIKGQRMIAVSHKLAPYVRPDDPSASEMTDLAEIDFADSVASDIFVQWDSAAGCYNNSPQ